MSTSNLDNYKINVIDYNCNISDSRDHGIYTMCTMVLKLRNPYKWENNLEPGQETVSGDLLDWIEDEPYRQNLCREFEETHSSCTLMGLMSPLKQLVTCSTGNRLSTPPNIFYHFEAGFREMGYFDNVHLSKIGLSKVVMNTIKMRAEI